MVFQGDTTYLVEGQVDYYSPVVFEGNAVIKYTSVGYGAASINLHNTFTFTSSMYRPAVFTAIDDDTVGESLSGYPGYTGDPSFSGPYASPALYTDDSGYHALYNGVTNVFFRFAAQAVIVDATDSGYYSYDLEFRHSQFVNCSETIRVKGCDSWSYISWPAQARMHLRNCLVSGTANAFVAEPYSYACLDCEYCTFDQVLTLLAVDPLCFANNSTFTNCILANVQDLGTTNQMSGGVNGFYQTAAAFGSNPLVTFDYPFQSVGGGAYYLADVADITNSVHWLTAADTNSEPADLLSQLRQLTTYPPAYWSPSGQMTLGPTVARDVGVTALGYHYAPLDYLFCGGYIEGIDNSVTVAAGTAIGWTGYGVAVGDSSLTFQGTATSNCWMVQSCVSQEQPQYAYPGDGGVCLADYYNISHLSASFTKWSVLGGSQNHVGYYCNAAFSANHCEFYGGGIAPWDSSSGTGFCLTNCLLDRVLLDLEGAPVSLRNCTLHGGALTLARSSGLSWLVEDSSFDGAAISLSDGLNGDTQYTLFNHNAFLYGADNLPAIAPGPNNFYETNFNWQAGSLGNYYLPTDSLLIDAGSTTADQIGLYHFTTQTNQVKEGNSVVDIGYHYVALDANGNPIDSDGDGTPDYLADANGNGQVDPGETPWQEIPPAIVSQPASQTVNAGTNVTFAVAASGTLPLSYQWQLNGTNLAGATASSFTRTNVQGPDVGQYRVIISNPWGSVTSSNAVLLVLPTITTQPIGRAVIVGSNVTFSVTATGSPLAYQWLFDGGAVSGAANTTLTLTNVQLAHAGSYSVLVSIFAAGIVSSNATLAVFPPGPAPVPAGLISWWPAETNALDAIGANNGTLTNGGYAAGEVGQAFNLNGTNQYVSIPDSSSLRQTNLTVEGWFNFAERSPRTRTLFGKANGGTTDSFTVWCSGAYVYACASASGSYGLYLSYPWIPPTNTWHHIALTFDGTTLAGALYVNGTNVANNTASGWPAFDTHALLLGADIKNGSVTNFFNGLIDEVSLYSRALSPAEIQSIYLAGSYGKSPPGSPQPGSGAETNYTGAVTFTNGASLFIFEPKPTSHIP